MDALSRLEDLKEAASRLSIEIVTSNLFDSEITIESGYCKVKGKDMIILDNQLTPEEQAKVILKTLKRFDLETIYLPSWIRERVESDHPIRFQT
ncbi:hypothetical protein UZ36_03675 [Candidatus Nitromaritima sp. SCGC AAA799-C22]|nr:hypothetical protein UZ36_03675 [Candidatus Nitromaritima sp. SCGC AAA799-C22]